MLINFRAYHEGRGLKFGPIEAWLAWREWVLEGEAWLAGPDMATWFNNRWRRDILWRRENNG